MSLFRPTAHKFARKLCCLVAVCLGLVSLSSSQAMAAVKPLPLPSPKIKGVVSVPSPLPSGKSTTTTTSEPMVCPGQTFAQSFLEFGDSNWYTLVAGSEFTEGPGGWELYNGASIQRDNRPRGDAGGVLDLPTGSFAVSPPTCVTLQYPTARTWVRSVSGADRVVVGVWYPGSRYGIGVGQPVALLGGTRGAWQLSNPFEVKPEMTGNPEGLREVRFVYSAAGIGDTRIWGLFVDPRMRQG